MFQIIYRVLSLLKNRKGIVSALLGANFVFAILILVEPIFFKEIIDVLINFSEDVVGNREKLISTLILWAFIGTITISLRLFISIYSDRMGHEEFDKYVSSFFNHIMNLSTRFHLDSNSGQLVKKITKGVDGIFATHIDFFRRVVPNILIILILIPTVIYLNWKLGGLVIIIGTLSAIFTLILATKTFSKQIDIEHIYSDMSSHYGDTFSNMPIVKSFSLSSFKNKELQKLTDLRIKKQFPILIWWGTIISFSQILRIIVSITVIFYGSYLFLNGEISIGEIVMFLGFSTILLASIEELTWKLESLFWRLAGIKDYFKIMDTEIEIKDQKGAKKLSEVQGKIEFQDLTFSYDGKRNVLKDINMLVKPGQKVAFVGHTGSGKTTMTNMILRFFEPQKGKVLIDDIDISTVSQASLRENIGVVFQDNSLFNTTILNNIKLGNKKSTRKDIERVAKKSHSTDFINMLSDGLDTVVGERGVKLSGGEKQRLAIARAFLKDAPILILDEATSALDAQTEKYLQDSFDELMKDRTTFIIAHRLSTIMKADTILVFDQGHIIEQGTYKDLVGKGGAFSKLVESQVKGFID